MGRVKKTNSIGETGRKVAANIKRLRGGCLLKDISERLSEIGRHITPLALARIESGERKVDVDDLMAFATIFAISPLDILRCDTSSPQITSKIAEPAKAYNSRV